ncbi:hypothetical protein ACFSGX_06465 [Sphingomonas arantia]|uniref:Uncharacterized protein n=1 Tax=Sphingomonas arantia TaxID=1460676 RepID=A0ABW4TXZ1_9SPHN
MKRARCRICGLKLRRGVGTRTWIIADSIGAPVRPDERRAEFG